MLFLSYLILGACAGLLAGLFGIGGGLIIVPVLVISFELQGMSPEVLTHVAVGTSLATIIVTSLSSIRSHHLKQAVSWNLFWPLAAGICLGAILGVKTAGRLSGPALQTAIGVFAVLIAIQMALGLRPKGAQRLPGRPALVGAGGVIGWASAIFGIGGGSLTVPYLSWKGVRMQEAVGTSAACGLPIALMGALANVEEGWGNPELMPWSLGYVYLPAFLGIVLASAYFARLGALLAHRLPATILRRIFALLLFSVGLRFLLAN
ncbi:sulfite exporter TauE/SafE family protein [Motiliproteus sp. SC1-56]|uniref:sulfite exporter TauE/SafE family protein n=1 Tax=Motiliproteus sp. SC1-56 TaxID=2799565 RepID=UPI001A8F1B1B|nr:sulfite exporter TauE/SafE family protein [Motiliproteus sp. SC1-56]